MSDQPQLQDQLSRVRIPLYGTEHGGIGTAEGQFHINVIPGYESNPITQQRQWFLEKRQGITMKGTSLTFAARLSAATGSVGKDLLAMSQSGLSGIVVYAIYDTNGTIKIFSYDVSSDAFVALGTITGADQRDFVHLSEIQDAAVLSFTPSLAVVWTKYDFSDSAAFYALTSSGAFVAASLTEITDTDFPTQTPAEILTGPMVQMNGTTYCMTTNGKIYNSDLLDVSSWNSLGLIQAIAYPDQGVGLVRYKHHIVAFGKDSVEFFNDNGEPPPASPLGRTEQAFIKFGCAGPYLFKNVDDTLYWIAISGSAGGGGLYKLEGYTPTRVSTPRYTARIGTSLDVQTNSQNLGFCRLQPFMSNGKRQIMLTGIYKSAGTITAAMSGVTTTPLTGQLVYCPEYNTWWIFSHMDSPNTSQTDGFIACGIVSNSGYRQNSQLILRIPTDSAHSTATYTGVYIMTSTSSAFDQNSVNTTLDIHCAATLEQLDFGNESRKFIRRATLLGQPLPYSSLNMYVAYCKNGYSTTAGDWIRRTIDTSLLPSSSTRYYVNNLGACRKVVFVLYWADRGSNVVLRDFELNVAQGTA
jgi:hypothetical protein